MENRNLRKKQDAFSKPLAVPSSPSRTKKKENYFIKVLHVIVSFLVVVFLYPPLFLFYLPRTIRNAQQRKKKKNKKIAQSIALYDDFSVQKSVSSSICYKEHRAVFKYNGLGRFDSWYNAVSIVLYEKSYHSAQKIKKEYENIFEHPLGWCENNTLLMKSNFWDILLHAMEILPKIQGGFACVGKNMHKVGAVFAGENSLKSFASVRYATRKSIPYVFPLVCAVLVFGYINHISSYDLQVMAYIDNQPIGIVESKSVMENAKNSLEESISSSIGISYKFDHSVEYKVVHTRKKEYLTSTQCYTLLNDKSKSSIIDAYALYIDGKLIAAHINEEAITRVISALEKQQESTETEDNVQAVKLLNDVQIVNQLCSRKSLKTPFEIMELLVGDTAQMPTPMNAVAVLELEKEISPQQMAAVGTANLSSDASPVSEVYSQQGENPENVNPDLDFGITRNSSADSKTQSDLYGVDLSHTYYVMDEKIQEFRSQENPTQLLYKTIKTEVSMEEVPYKTVYQDSDRYYIGEERMKVQGLEGMNKVTYEVVYVDNQEQERKIVGQETLREPETAVIVKGTAKRPATAPTGVFMWPKQGPIGSAYGGRVLFGSYDFHLGIDISGNTGEAIYAADGGTVTFAGRNSSYGNLVIINHGNGLQTYYAHQSELLVSAGQKVFKGQQIGRVGETGVATGPHLHFEVRQYGSTVNPFNYLP